MLAKLSKPRLHASVPRSRLFERLDARARHPITWICAPAGAGKSTLAAGYVEARGARTAWVHLDAGDRDPATLFYFLRELAPFEARAAIPVLTPEHALNLAGFSHLFFRALFSALPSGLILVLDNVQEAMCADLGLILKEGLAEVPAMFALLLISRERLPAILSRYRLSGALQVIDWDDLKFTGEEVRDLAERLGVQEARAIVVRDLVDGWAAGLFLMLSGTASALPSQLRNEALFEYFAGEVFERAQPEEREILLVSSLLTEFSASLASDVTGITDTRAILDRLYKAQFFITRSDGQEPAFRFHALFREFLLGRLIVEKSPHELTVLRRAAAEALAKRGRNEEAIGLLLSAQEYDRAAERLRTVAAELVKFGRGNVLLAWLSSLPEGRIAADPWLTYWRGAAVLWSNPGDAYEWFSRAYHEFDLLAERIGQLTAAVSALDAIDFAIEDFRAKDPWIERVEQLLRCAGSMDGELRIRAWGAFLFAALDRSPAHPRISQAVSVLLEALDCPFRSSDLHVYTLVALMYYAFASLNEGICERALREFEACEDRDKSSPSTLCAWYQWVGWYFFARGDWNRAIDSFGRMASVAGAAKIETLQRAGEASSALMLVVAGRLEEAQWELDRLDGMLVPQQHMAVHMLKKGQALFHYGIGAVSKAISCMEATVRSVDALGIPDVCACTRIDMLEILLSAGQVEQARDLVEEAAGFVANSHHRYLDAALAAGRGVTGCPPGREPTREQIAQCMDMLREPGMRGSLLVMRKVASSICNHALKYGIRTQLARQLIASERLEPPEDASTDWPWFVRIRTLGDFDVAVDGASLQKAGRSPHKVLELLKLLVAAGPRPQYVPALSDLLWPDADGADAKVSMHTTLHRLRRLLRDDRAVRLQDGKLWLDRSLCWTDVGSFERGSEALLRCDRAFDLDQRARGQQCLSLYAGPLMPGCDHPFVLAARDRLHAKFLKLTIRLADAFAHADRTRECIATLERGLELDPANEPLAARLAQQLVQLGRTDEAALLRAQGPGRP